MHHPVNITVEKNMKILFAAILILLTQLTFAQKESVNSLFQTFEKDIEVEQSYHSGKVIWDDDTKESYYSLMKIAPIDSLIKFIDNSNAAIRCIIFGGLLNKNADKKILSKILDKYHNDTAVYKSAPTDVQITWMVNEYMQTAFKYHDTTKNEMDYDKMLAILSEYPRIVLPSLRHGNIRKEEIIRIDSLGFNYNNLKILSFTAIFVRKSENEVLKNESNLFSTAMKEKILQLKSEDVLVLDDIKVIAEDGTERTFASFSIRIE